MDEALKKYYDAAYTAGKNTHFLKYRHGRTLAEEHVQALTYIDDKYDGPKRHILDFGCGEADFLCVVDRFERRTGIDFSEVALNKARDKSPELNLRIGTERLLDEFEGLVDVVTSFGTLEHLADPEGVFRGLMRCVKWSDGGALIVSCPSFLNVRGLIWMTLVQLFDVPMSLSDKHFISPSMILSWLEGEGRSLTMYSVDHDVAEGEYFEVDLRKRLNNALRDAWMDNSKVDKLISWVRENQQWFPRNDFSGANMVYLIR